jgi:MFS family permease
LNLVKTRAIYHYVTSSHQGNIAMLIVGGFLGVFRTVSTVRLVDERTPPEWASTVQAIMNAGAGGIASLAASLVGGAIFDALGPPSVFALAAGFVGLAATLLSVAAARGAFKGTPDLAQRGALFVTRRVHCANAPFSHL